MHANVISFWFDELGPNKWFAKDPSLDARITERFSSTHEQASRCELHAWRATARGRLAEVLLLDQFSRNMFRDSPRAFAQDPLALALAQEAVRAGADNDLTPSERNFLYMPFMHSESLVVHEVAVELFTKNGIAQNLDYERKHKAVLDRFGRYPHRNAILGRPSTPEEVAFLSEPGSSF
jgi:uncharacterized protein (DUF924 family)